MYGVIVVPTSASAATSAAWPVGSAGTTSPLATALQSGCTMNALAGYATYARTSTRSARSTTLYEKNTTSDQMTTPAAGTATIRCTPRSSSDARTDRITARWT